MTLSNRDAIAARGLAEETPDAVKELNWNMIILLKAVLKPFADTMKRMDGEKVVTISAMLVVVCLLRMEIDNLEFHDNTAFHDAAESVTEGLSLGS